MMNVPPPWIVVIRPLMIADQLAVDMIRNFGTVIDDDAVRSLVLSTRLLGTREIMIINHTGCEVLRFSPKGENKGYEYQ